MQAVCDHRGIFMDYDLGWLGSISDSMVWKESNLWMNQHKYFASDKYILVDKGLLLVIVLKQLSLIIF